MKPRDLPAGWKKISNTYGVAIGSPERREAERLVVAEEMSHAAPKVRLYVSGPMSGCKDYNFPAFDLAEASLLEAGFEVENPATKGVIDGWDWHDYLRYDIKQMMDCQGLALLPGWNNSRGARVEVDLARALDMPVRLVNAWLGPSGT